MIDDLPNKMFEYVRYAHRISVTPSFFWVALRALVPQKARSHTGRSTLRLGVISSPLPLTESLLCHITSF